MGNKMVRVATRQSNQAELFFEYLLIEDILNCNKINNCIISLETFENEREYSAGRISLWNEKKHRMVYNIASASGSPASLHFTLALGLSVLFSLATSSRNIYYQNTRKCWGSQLLGNWFIQQLPSTALTKVPVLWLELRCSVWLGKQVNTILSWR